MDYNYKQICSDLIRNLPPRTKDVISRRFGLKEENRETLQTIGDNYKITRERVRQIETDGFLKINPALKDYQAIFNNFYSYIQGWGGVKKEDSLLSELGQGKFNNEVFFLLTLGEPFNRYPETDNFYTLWAVEESSLDLAQKVINCLVNKFKKIKSPLSEKDIFEICQRERTAPSLNQRALQSFIETSKSIWQGPGGTWGLFDWPEINPRGIKDKAYLVFKQKGEPLHFTKVASLIDELNGRGGMILPQTVHNELIRDERFVLVGRGLYALKEWGYEPGLVKDIILKIIKKSKNTLSREQIVKQVLEQRLVKPSTVLANLQDRTMFIRDEKGGYGIKNSSKSKVQS